MSRHIGIYTAIDDNDNKVHIEDVPPLKERQKSPNTYKCEICGGKLIARTGTQKRHHFAHKNAATCDKWIQPMSDWHRNWQLQFPQENREITIKENSAWHRADVCLFDQNGKEKIIIEFQHSPMSDTEFSQRCQFYTNKNRELFWVFDWTDKEISIHHKVEEYEDESNYDTAIEKAKTGRLYVLEGKRLPSWKYAFKRLKDLRKSFPRVRVLLQLTGDSGTGMLFDVIYFHERLILGSFIKSEDWLDIVKSDDLNVCSIILDKRAAGLGREDLKGVPGKMIELPDVEDEENVYAWYEGNQRIYGLRRHAFDYKSERTFVLKVRYPKKHLQITDDSNDGKDEHTITVSDNQPTKEEPRIEPVEPPVDTLLTTQANDICSVLDTIKGRRFYIPTSTKNDAVLHLPLEDYYCDDKNLTYTILCNIKSRSLESQSYPWIIEGALLMHGKSRDVILVIKDGEDTERKIQQIHDEHPTESIICIDLEQYKRNSGKSLITDDCLESLICGVDSWGQPHDYGSVRQWLFNVQQKKEKEKYDNSLFFDFEEH